MPSELLLLLLTEVFLGEGFGLERRFDGFVGGVGVDEGFESVLEGS